MTPCCAGAGVGEGSRRTGVHALTLEDVVVPPPCLVAGAGELGEEEGTAEGLGRRQRPPQGPKVMLQHLQMGVQPWHHNQRSPPLLAIFISHLPRWVATPTMHE